MQKQNPAQKPKKIKFIRKEWARYSAMLDRMPQHWFLYAGWGLVLLGFGAAIYEFVWLGMLGG